MPALVDRPKMTRITYENLKRHIMKERAKIKQEQEQDAMIERMRKEREQRKKKEAEEALTLEQTKEQISQMEKRLEELRSQKHQLFLQLKKVLNQEDETRRRAQIKEQSEMQILQQQQQAAFSQHGLGPPVMMLQAQHMSSRPSLCKPVQIAQTPMKRTRSPSPPASSSYQTSYHSDPKYGAYSSKPGPSHMYAQHASASDFKLSSYPQSQAGQPVYASQSAAAAAAAHSFVAAQQQGQQPPPPQQTAVTAFQTSHQGAGVGVGGKYSAGGGQSAFSNYGAHFSAAAAAAAHQSGKGAPEGFPPTSYSLQRMPQSGFHPQHNASLQHQLEQAQKSAAAFPEDKYKQSSLRGLAGSQQGSLMPQALMQQQSSKGSIVTGMPGQPSSSYQSSAPTVSQLSPWATHSPPQTTSHLVWRRH